MIQFNVAEPLKVAPVWVVIVSTPELATVPLPPGLGQLLSVFWPETV